jgi:tetratricopeptide (TPR) repeat protein
LQGYARTYLLTGEHLRAEQLARDSLELVGDAVNDHYSVYANSVHALAESLRRQYKLEESGRLQRELLKVQIDRLGAQSQIVARTWNNLSHVMRASGKYQEAEDALRQALAIYEKDPRESTFDLAVTYHNLGGLQHEARQYTQALQSLARAMQLKQQLAAAGRTRCLARHRLSAAARRVRRALVDVLAVFRHGDGVRVRLRLAAILRRQLLISTLR